MRHHVDWRKIRHAEYTLANAALFPVLNHPAQEIRLCSKRLAGVPDRRSRRWIKALPLRV
jgi:hypothetical protein